MDNETKEMEGSWITRKEGKDRVKKDQKKIMRKCSSWKMGKTGDDGGETETKGYQSEWLERSAETRGV